MKPTITVEGRLGGDPDFRFTPAGVAVASFSLACSERVKNEQTGEWEDKGETLWFRVTAWRNMAENVAESLKKGDQVIVIGKLDLRTYTAKDETERTSLEIQAFSVGPSLQFRTTRHSKDQERRDAALAPAEAPTDDSEPPF